MIGINKGALRQTVTSSTLKLELKFNYQVYTDLAATVAATTNDYVRAWKSSVGGHLFTQSTDAARPQRQSDGLYFDGGDFLSMLMHNDFNWGTGDFTFEFWSYTAGYNPMAIGDQNGANAALLLFNAVLYMQSSVGTWGVAALSTGTNVVNSWTHWAVVRQSGTIRTYKAGVQQATISFATAPIFSTAYNFFIGKGNGFFFTGKYNDIRLYTECRYPNGTAFTPPTRSA